MKLIYELDNQKHEIVLEGQKEVLLGRGEDCDIIIPSSNISRTHAKLSSVIKSVKSWTQAAPMASLSTGPR